MRLVYKDFPLPSHSLAMPAHEAARCAGEQGRYWAYHDVLFERQPRFERCLDSRRFRAAVEADFAEGRELGVRSTPTFLINGKPIVGAQPVDRFRAAIDDALQARR